MSFKSENVNSLSQYLVQSSVKFLIELKKGCHHICVHILLSTVQKINYLLRILLLNEKKKWKKVLKYVLFCFAWLQNVNQQVFGFHVQYWREVNLRWNNSTVVCMESSLLCFGSINTIYQIKYTRCVTHLGVSRHLSNVCKYLGCFPLQDASGVL